MITPIVTMAFIWCLFFGKIPQPYLISICAALGALLVYLNRHKYSQFLPIDVLAQNSRLKEVNAALKFWTLLILMAISVSSSTSATGVFLAMAALVFAVCVGGLSLHAYVRIMALPVSFLLIGGLALLFEVTPEPVGVLSFKAFGLWFCVNDEAQSRTALIVARAFGAVGCLTLLSATTPMPEIISVLRRARCPELIIDLMYLIYRYIFILLSVHGYMLSAAKSRLGFRDYRVSLRTTGKIYSNLLARSYQFAGKNFDAMESRCYETGIRFLENRGKITGIQAAVAIVITVVTLGISLIIR